MMRILFTTLCLCLALASGYDGLYGVVNGGTIHQYDPVAYGDADWLYFANGIKFDVRQGEPELPESLMKSESRYYIVHCEGPVYPEYMQRIKQTGATVYSYIPNYAFLVKMNELIKNQVAQIEFVDWIGLYQPAYKLSGQEEFRDLQGNHEITILLYPEADLNTVLDYLDEMDARIVDVAPGDWYHTIRCDVDLARVPHIASIEEVSWLEPWHKMEPHNANVQWIVQTATSGNRRIWDMGIRGDGQLVSTCDSGVRTSHYAFRSTNSSWLTTWGDYPNDRKIIAYKPANTYGPGYADFGDEGCNFCHGSHVSGTVCGNDDVMGSPSNYDGVAPNSRLYFCDGGGSLGCVYIPTNLYTLFSMPYTGNAAGSVKIMSNSWGNSVAGQYTAEAIAVDLFVYLNKDFLLCFSNGNDGPGAMTVGSPATAKNCISVGGCRNSGQLNSIYYYSSRGPTQDGRFKPTVLTPGQTVTSVNGFGDTGYSIMDGTSMASPSAAAAAVLARQYFVDGWYPSGSANPADSLLPSAALLKAVLVNSADRGMSGFTVPDNNVGWGRIDLDSVLYFAGDTRELAVVDNAVGVSTGQYVEYTYNVASSAVPLRATLVWSDYPGAGGAGIKLVNNLNLLVTDPTSNQYRGNVYNSGQSTTGGNYDTLNVEECVRIDAPQTGNWTIRITGVNVPYGPQAFALVVTGDLAGTGIEELQSSHDTKRFTIYPLVSYASPYRLSYTLDTQVPLRVEIFDAAGRMLDDIDYGMQNGTGELMIRMNRFASGIYFIKVAAGSISELSKVIWVR
ncbi:MAG: S8 family serine peptidase [candidate division WOR-3 bacterium]